MGSFSNVSEISVQEFAALLEGGDPLQVIDVRSPDQVAAGRIDVAPPSRFHNIVGSRLLRVRSLNDVGIDPELPAVVVCSRGHDSVVVAAHLNALGCRATSLHGGMAVWMRLVVSRDLEPPPSLDRFIQFDRPGNGALGYLLVSGKEAVAVDPPRDASAYLSAARHAGADVVAVADTHIHADYISGCDLLARTLRVPYYLHPRDAVYPYDGTRGRIHFCGVEDGDVVRFGRCAVRVLHTPGHTEGSVCYVVDDTAVMSGDFVFITSVGRPDLAGKTSEWTADLWESLQKIRRAWRPNAVVCPAHYGSAAERRPDGTVAASFATLLARNEAFQLGDRATFEQWVTGRTASFPDAYRTIKAVNLGLLDVSEEKADELEFGRNQCALAGPPAPAPGGTEFGRPDTEQRR